MTRKDLAEQYVRFGSFRRLAEHLGVEPRTVQYWFRTLKLRGIRAKPHKRTSAMERWLLANPGARLPPSASKIAKLSGLRVDLVSAYFRRRAANVAAYVEQLGDLRERTEILHAVSVDAPERALLVPPRAIASYVVRVNQWTLDVSYEGVLRAGVAFRLVMPYTKVRDFWKPMIAREDKGETTSV